MLFGCRVVSTRAARSSRPGSTGLFFPKLVEPVCERQRVGRVETVVRVVGVLGRVCRSGVGGFDSAVRWRSRAGSTGLFFPKLVEPVCERQRVGRVETVVRVVGVLGRVCRSGVGGFDSAVRWRSRAGSTGLFFPKLVEPVCERQRVGRVETVVRVSGGSGVGCVVRVPGVSTRAARSSRPGSTGLFFRSWLSRPASGSEWGVSKPGGARLWACGRGCGVASTQPFASLTRWLNQLGKWVPRRWGMAG